MESRAGSRELTLRAILIGLVLSIVMAGANVYLGLKAGMTVSASIPAAVLGMLILRTFFRDGSLLEANQIQTAASAGESLAAGIIFTMPALVLIGAWQRFDLFTTTLIAFSGGLLGILFMIPMRRTFVVDNRDLPYPEGLACAAVLRAGEGDDADEGAARAVLWGGLLGGTFKLLVGFATLLKSSLEGAVATGGGRILFLGADMSPALMAVGFIVRLNVALLIFAGGAFGWLICIPLLPEINALLGSISPELAAPFEADGSTVDRAWALWSQRIRYIGVGAMAVGGVASIVDARHGLRRAIGELRRLSTPRPAALGDRDLPPGPIAGISMIVVLSIGAIYLYFTDDVVITLLLTTIMVAISFFFVAVSCYIVGLVGNSNNPVSGMTITAVLATGGLLTLLGYSGASGMLATLGVAAIVCCAACTAGDVCNDLKTGSLVGATPWRQQVMQIAGVAVASVVMAPVLQLLHDAYGIGSRELAAPQASLFASLAQGFFGDGDLPWGMVLFGAAVGLLVLPIDATLRRRGSRFRAHLMPIAVGVYLPFGLSIPILAGGLLAEWRGWGTRGADGAERKLRRGVLAASGVIAGESLVGIAIAMWISAGLTGLAFDGPHRTWLTAVAAVLTALLFARLTRPAAGS